MLEKEINEVLRESGHDYVAQLIQGEEERQAKNIELIASENFPSEAVKAAAAQNTRKGIPKRGHSEAKDATTADVRMSTFWKSTAYRSGRKYSIPIIM